MIHEMAESNYDILGISLGASKQQIRIAFRELALKHHSDRGCLLYTSDAADE